MADQILTLTVRSRRWILLVALIAQRIGPPSAVVDWLIRHSVIIEAA